MKLKIVSPTRALIVNATEDEMDHLRKQLTYNNTSAAHLLKRHYNNKWYRQKSPEAWQAQLNALKADVTKTLVFNEGFLSYIRPGSIPHIQGLEIEVQSEIVYPTSKKIPWNKPLPFELYNYQEESWQKLINVKHGNVELCTGSGKSAILLKYCRETGYNTAIIAPSKSIFKELCEKFEYHLGKGNIGYFGDGKKKIGKKFTICIADSLCNIEQGSPEWEFFSNLDAFCADESHTWGAETLDQVCHGVLEHVPNRVFLSGTQTRGDGGEKLLYSIIGNTVCSLGTAEAKAKGYIHDHDFTIVQIESSNPNFQSQDALEMKRIHYLGNKNIAAFAAKIANATALAGGLQTLILVEELSQIAMLTKLLKVPFAYAHSESKKERLEELGLTKVKPEESVEAFNRNEVKVLIGTSCIATGTNIYPMASTINWVGGTSEIKTKQGTVGRTVRLHNANPYKDKCKQVAIKHIYDFDVYDISLMHKHLKERLVFYEDSGSEIKLVKVGG